MIIPNARIGIKFHDFELKLMGIFPDVENFIIIVVRLYKKVLCILHIHPHNVLISS